MNNFMNNRRDFLKYSMATVPALTMGLPSVEEPKPDVLKVFCLDYGGDVSYIVAKNSDDVKHWWFTELGGEEIPSDAKVTEISLNTILVQSIEDINDVSEYDRKNYLYYKLIEKNNNHEHEVEWIGIELKWLWDFSPHQFIRVFSKDHLIHFFIKKPAKLFLQDVIDNDYPIPCCFCSTAN